MCKAKTPQLRLVVKFTHSNLQRIETGGAHIIAWQTWAISQLAFRLID